MNHVISESEVVLTAGDLEKLPYGTIVSETRCKSNKVQYLMKSTGHDCYPWVNLGTGVAREPPKNARRVRDTITISPNQPE